MDQKFVKIIHATYGLLDFFPDQDPLKNKAKEKALSLLDSFVLLEGRDKDVEKIKAQVIADMTLLEQYLELAKHQGWLGGFNLLILLKEYHALTEGIKGTYTAVPLVQEHIPLLENGKMQDVSSHFTLRQEKIIKILSQRDQVQVADLLKEIPSVTKRTLRRDLDDLLKKGKITRIGEWNQASYRLGQDRTV